MKLKQLEQELQQIAPFEKPKIHFEQYPTTAHLAAHMLFTAIGFGDIEEKTVLDLGIGCGMLTIGAIICGSAYNIGLDIDPDALEQARRNLEDFEADCDLVRVNVQDLLTETEMHFQADTVLMNPPFGTKLKGVDMDFLRVASKIATKAIYTLHKTSTREHVLRVGESLGFKGRVIAELTYDLPATYKFHKKANVAIQVDFIRSFVQKMLQQQQQNEEVDKLRQLYIRILKEEKQKRPTNGVLGEEGRKKIESLKALNDRAEATLSELKMKLKEMQMKNRQIILDHSLATSPAVNNGSGIEDVDQFDAVFTALPNPNDDPESESMAPSEMKAENEQDLPVDDEQGDEDVEMESPEVALGSSIEFF